MDGLVTIESNNSAAETAYRVENSIKKKGLHVFARINHAEEAASVGLDLLPTELFLFGNPRIGTLLMQNAPSVAIDLPMKILVTKNKNGKVYVQYNELNRLKTRHGITDQETLDKIKNVVENICRAAIK